MSHHTRLGTRRLQPFPFLPALSLHQCTTSSPQSRLFTSLPVHCLWNKAKSKFSVILAIWTPICWRNVSYLMHNGPFPHSKHDIGIQLCKNYSIDGRDLFYKWEALNFNTKPRLFNADSVSELRQQLQREAAKATKRNIPNPKSNLSGLLSKNLLALGRQSALGPKSIKAEGKGVARLSKVAFKDETRDSGRPMRCECDLFAIENSYLLHTIRPLHVREGLRAQRRYMI